MAEYLDRINIQSTVSVDEIIGRIAKQFQAAMNQAVHYYTVKKILKFTHLQLHTVIPNLLREYLTINVAYTLNTSKSYYAELDLRELKADANGDGTPDTPVFFKEIHSVVYFPENYSSVNAPDPEPYKKAISLEHFAGLKSFDEDATWGRYWFPNRGMDVIPIFQGSEVQKNGETKLTIGGVRELSTAYATASKSALRTMTMDCPSEAIQWLVSQSVRECAIDKRYQLPESLGTELADQTALLKGVDQAIAQQLQANDMRGVDIR